MANQRIPLNDGNQIPVIGLGTYLAKGKVIENIIKQSIDLGYRLIDTAFVYGNEKEIGKAFEEKLGEGNVRREDLFIVGKLWNTKHHPDDVIPAMKRTLADLRLDYLDLYLIHWPIAVKQVASNEFDEFANPEADIPLEDTWLEMEKCVKLGYAKSIGISNFNSEQIERILMMAEIKPVVNQVEYNPYFNPEKLKRFCDQRKIVLMGYSPFTRENIRSLFSEPIINKLGEKYGKSPAQITLRFLIQCQIVPIPKSGNPDRLRENLDIFDFELSPEDFEKMRSLNRMERSTVMETARGFKEYPFNIEY